MEVSRLEVKLELQLLPYTTATATRDLSHVCNLHYTSRQHQILNSLSEARDQTHILMDTSWVCNPEPHWELPRFCSFVLNYSFRKVENR